ncbi:hydrogenase maturation protease [Ferroglobus placidus DSM 10642]|uniref:Hydrogenase maturation protease n=1 Tax=Ferroglobus placidus (strain DSM 10642 / AEDII12DO) TaxID=589924 RepID=D3S1L4_FERPA|nr:hydrogenase maturation protease [Ferroglobus placidus]ADC66478.1 hydrogenase maturation protease [Ferroglobus placidus DSM 10642]
MIVVIGVGNLLMKDDGFGIHVIERLKAENINAEIVDAMTNVQILLSAMEGKRKAIIVDAIDFEGEVGEIKIIRFDPEKIPEDLKLSVHDIHFRDAIAMAKGIYDLPDEIVVVGVKPKEIKPEIGLSEELEKRIEEVVEIIKRKITSSGT